MLEVMPIQDDQARGATLRFLLDIDREIAQILRRETVSLVYQGLDNPGAGGVFLPV